jgi:uncharacterized repeat protein (TIGR03803 family)
VIPGLVSQTERLEERTLLSVTPTLSTTPGGTVTLGSGARLTDTANLSGGSNPTGTITSTLSAPDNVTVVDNETVAVAGNGTYSTPTGYVPSAAGTYHWAVSYSGDALNNPVTPFPITPLASFNGSNGSAPDAGVIIDGAGNLYGTTQSGGASSDGTIFELAHGSSTINALASFDSGSGTGPSGVIMDGAGNLYGTTAFGGVSPNNGTVFELAHGNSTITALATFVFSSGNEPIGGLIRDGAGNLYGTTFLGGAGATGTVFELVQGNSTTTGLATFLNGAHPLGGVIMDGAGNLYGTTSEGGASGVGTVFELAHGSSSITTLASFNGSNGATPFAGLIMDGAGNLYGTTDAGGASGDGTVFELAHGSGSITTLASFNGGNGANPDGGVIMDAAGNFYGTTSEGGASGDGTVFELVHGSSTITMLSYFKSGNDEDPFGGVIMDGAGNLYGATSGGGASGNGIVFKLDRVANSEPESVVQPTATISGSTFDDANGDGNWETGELGLRGVTINLYRETNGQKGLQTGRGGDVLVSTQLSGASGAYRFSGLGVGTYYVDETVPVGFVSTTTDPVTINASAGSLSKVIFGDARLNAHAMSGAFGIGFWKSHASMITAGDLARLSTLYLRNPDGSRFAFPYTKFPILTSAQLSADQTAFGNFLGSANTKNSANILSALVLNVRWGRLPRPATRI